MPRRPVPAAEGKAPSAPSRPQRGREMQHARQADARQAAEGRKGHRQRLPYDWIPSTSKQTSLYSSELTSCLD